MREGEVGCYLADDVELTDPDVRELIADAARLHGGVAREYLRAEIRDGVPFHVWRMTSGATPKP